MSILGTLEHRISPITELEQLLGVQWPSISAARQAARDKIETLEFAISGETSPDTSLIVYGSLAREEFTQGSDLDWTLLVDGQANPQHQKELISIRTKLEAEIRGPGREKTFGKLTFSHPLLHMIGGDEDTNANTTRRVLFLLEAIPIGAYKQAFDRVRKHILHRYLTEDHGLSRNISAGNTRWVPLFLLNDMARYWRTMAVDFAYKQWDRGNDGYALRNLKLGTSRKLIYASGLLSCFWCDPTISKGDYANASAAEKIWTLSHNLHEMLLLTPLERFARFFLTHSENSFLVDSASDFFKTYDEFLKLLEDKSTREYLDRLLPEAIDDDSKFQLARSIRTRFEEGVKKIFLHAESPLYDLTISRGIF